MRAIHWSIIGVFAWGCAASENASTAQPAPPPPAKDDARSDSEAEPPDADVAHTGATEGAATPAFEHEDDHAGVGSSGLAPGAGKGGVVADEELGAAPADPSRGGRPRPKPSKRSKKEADYGAPARQQAAALKAGRHDDNAQYNRFLEFLGKNAGAAPYRIDVTERLVVRALDTDGKALHNCDIQIKNLKGELRSRSTTYADGRTHFFPSSVSPDGETDYTVRAECAGKVRNGQLSRSGRRETELRFPSRRKIPKRVPVDIAVVLDTTGSMSSQINRLKATLQAIHVQLTVLPTQPDVRFALVAYRDRGDAYVTQVTTFTDDVELFQRTLNALDADGGGDTPEDLQSALADAMNKLPWRSDAVRVGFIVADAVPHTDYGQKYTYVSAMTDSLERGIKWVSVGAGGLPLQGEVIFRQIAQFTMGEYVFVTSGAAGDTTGGRGEASHHVGTNYKTENLDQAMVRIVRRELSHLSDRPRDFDSTIVATATKPLPRDVALAPAVQEALRQLVDYSAIRLEGNTPVAVAPFTVNDKKHKGVAEYLTDQMVLFASREAALRLVDRDLEAVVQEVSYQLSDLFDPEKSVAVGKMVGAELLIVGKMTVRDGGADIFARLVRVETGEVLSVAKVRVDRNVLSST